MTAQAEPILTIQLQITRVTHGVDKLDLAVTRQGAKKQYAPKLVTAANTPALLSQIVTILDGAR